MKKQVLFIAALAFLASNLAFGQDSKPGSITRGTTCAGTALTPIAGNSYDYSVAATPSGGNFLFWATTDQTFISSSGDPLVTITNVGTRLTTPLQLTATSVNYGISGPTDVVSITWSDAVLAAATGGTPTFVAAYYTAPAAGCADNFNAWEIKPINAFIVDIRNIDDASMVIQGYGAAVSECVDQVRGAVYNAGNIEYNFGVDTLYYEVIAANFTGSWTPTFELLGYDAVETPVITWTDIVPASWGAGTTWYPQGTTVPTTQTTTKDGVSIYVRVILTHNNFENNATAHPAGIDLTLTVDGVNTVGLWDIENNTLLDPGPLCNPGTLNDKMDLARQTLKPRPALVGTPAFLPGNQKN